MADNSIIQSEPVSLTAALTAAVNSTLGILSLIFDWSADVTAGLLTASGAWIVVVFLLYTRAQVTPNASVALTKDDVALINMGKAEEVSTPAPVLAHATTAYTPPTESPPHNPVV